MQNVGSRSKRLIVATSAIIASATLAGATGTGNAGADAVIGEVTGLTSVAVAVVGAAILCVVVPWGAKMAVKAFKAIGGA